MAENTSAIQDGDQNNQGTVTNNSYLESRSHKLGFTLPPSGFLARALTRTLIAAVGWTILWTMIGDDLLPGGNLFGIFIILVFSALGGFLISNIPYIVLPSLFGMLIVGFLLRNVPGIDVAKHINKQWSATLRSIALVVILIRSGLELDPVALKKLKFTCIRLAFGPCIAEAVTVAIVVRYFLGMPWLWSFQLGFVLGAVSPAVVVPQLLVLQEKGYGVQQGIPTLVMAASSCDDVLAISLFGVFLGIAFSEGNLYFNIFRGPLELLLGVAIGCLAGLICWFLPNKKETDRSRVRFVLLSGFGLLSLFGCNAAQFSGAGALGVLTMAFIAAYKWGEEEKTPINNAMSIVWEFFQPLLFGLIGAEISLDYLDGRFVGKCVGALVICITMRMLVTFLIMAGNKLTNKEKAFVAIAWLPKATVQAAIGSLSLDIARQRGYAGKPQEEYGIQIITMAVLSILLTAPVGAAGIALAGPLLMRRVQPEEQDMRAEDRLLCIQERPNKDIALNDMT
ncbi:sodium/hydrogen exchanger 9B2-like [Actinia tenebrosa]|uniref:Sodium/hydrogen exchanger 9B2-like n=1 Tax=Actinia tenebrosa TaxID=6105 RepID=A0A6P8ICX7_ACTTE|nr:sodium/hydrogen exchanger 9B2-like [Actinia tenebrosa]